MSVFENVPATWSAGEVTTKKTTYQSRRVGSNMAVATGAVPPVELSDGVLLCYTESITVDAGVTVYWRTADGAPGILTKTELEA